MQAVRRSRVTHVPVALLFALCAASEPMHAGAIALGGFITQSTQDSGVPAAANPGLNNIVDGDAYSVILNFAGGIASPGTYALTSVLFTDGTASENGFISGSLTITQAAGIERFSVLGCLIDASTCLLGNELDLNFQIPAAQLNQTGVAAQPIPGLLPLDLLEDGGSTDIQGSVTSYSYAAASQAPEPSTMGLIGASILALIAIRNKTTLGGKRC